MTSSQSSNTPVPDIPAPIPPSIPRHVGTFPVVFPLLRHILSLCRDKWICDFLFTTDPAHLTALTAPLLTAHALTCDVTISRFQPHAASQHRQHLDASFVFVPAFSVSHISVGFGMQENRYVCTQQLQHFDPQPRPHSSALEKEQFRYARDDNTGVLIMIYDFPHDGYVRLEYMSHQSSICRLRSFCHINRKVLMNAIHEHDGVLSAEKMFPALTLFQAVHEYRQCPMCGATVDAPCSCQLDLVAPTHSLDFRNGAKHMSSHIGAFQGLANLQLFAKGSALKHAMLGCRTLVQGGSAPDLVSRLTKWAITEHLKEVPQNPMTSLLTFSGTGSDCFDVAPPEIPEAELSLKSTKIDVDSMIDGVLLDSILDTQMEDSHDVEANVVPEPSNVLQLENWHDAEFSTGFLRSSFQDDGGVRGPLNHEQISYQDPGALTETITCQGSSIVKLGTAEIRPIVVNGEENELEMSDGQLGLEFLDSALGSAEDQQDEELSPSKPESSSVAKSGIRNSSKQEGSQKQTTLLPLQSNSRIQDNCMVPLPLHELDEKARLKELKKQLKRERNRASAKRSNTKKKHENDARKRERLRLKELEVKLRCEEQRLRKENLTLRKELHAQRTALT